MGIRFHNFLGRNERSRQNTIQNGAREANAGVYSYPHSTGQRTGKQNDYNQYTGSKNTRYRQDWKINFSTGMATPPKQPQKKYTVWPWIIVAFAVLAIVSSLVANNDTAAIPPPGASPKATATVSVQAVAAAALPTAEPVATRIPTPTPSPTPTQSPTETPSKVLREGMQGTEVQTMQERLIELKYLNAGEADGKFGSGTKKAVMSFQWKNSLEVDGIAGQKTLSLLYSENAK